MFPVQGADHAVRNADLTDEWAQRFLRDVHDALDTVDHPAATDCPSVAVDKAKVVEDDAVDTVRIVEGDSSWLQEES